MASTARAANSIHQPNDHYVSRLPMPPRLNFTGVCQWTDASVPDIRPPLSFDSLPFLKEIDWQDIFLSKKIPDWQYESRREAQSILPFLYLGPSTVCRDLEFLRDAGIHMILAVRHAGTIEAKPFSQGLKRAEEAGISITKVDVLSSQELIAAFPTAIATINNHLSNETIASRSSNRVPPSSAVLVCCESGNARSAAVVVAYCMEVLGIGLERALHLVHARRFCTSLDDSLKMVLSSYADILQARRDVSETYARMVTTSSTSSASQPFKRPRDGEDEEMRDVGDIERFENRSFTPFRP